MTVELFLNELSVPDDDIDLDGARTHFKRFVGAVRAATKFGGGAIFNADISINDITIGSEFSVARLRNLHECVEESIFLKTLQSRSPFERVADELGNAIAALHEYRIAEASQWENAIAAGLGFACLYGGLAVSFDSHDFWQKSRILLLQQYLDSEAEDITSSHVESRNCCSAERALVHQSAFAPEAPSDGEELWERRAEVLPHLRFIPRVRAQIMAFPRGDRSFQSAFVRLVEIDRAIGKWKDGEGEYPAWTCKVTPESEPRIGYGLVDFQNENGVTLTFSDHARFGPIEGRIHFRVEVAPDRYALIGHVGRKLGIG